MAHERTNNYVTNNIIDVVYRLSFYVQMLKHSFFITRVLLVKEINEDSVKT